MHFPRIHRRATELIPCLFLPAPPAPPSPVSKPQTNHAQPQAICKTTRTRFPRIHRHTAHLAPGAIDRLNATQPLHTLLFSRAAYIACAPAIPALISMPLSSSHCQPQTRRAAACMRVSRVHRHVLYVPLKAVSQHAENPHKAFMTSSRTLRKRRRAPSCAHKKHPRTASSHPRMLYQGFT